MYYRKRNIISACVLLVFCISFAATADTDSDSSSGGESTESKEEDILGVYENSLGGKVILRRDGSCYMHDMNPGETCKYEIGDPTDKVVEVDLEFEKELPGQGYTIDGEYRNGYLRLSFPGMRGATKYRPVR